MKNYLPDILPENKRKNLFLACDFNINLLNREYNKQVHIITSLLFQFYIDHIITNAIFENYFESVIVKSKITYHFPLIFSTNSKIKNKAKDEPKEGFIYKETFDKISLKKLKENLKKDLGSQIKV